MKALIFSDSHGRTENLVKAMDRYPDFQAIFHLGDVGNDEAYIRSLTPYPVYMVRGNCDFSSSLKESMVIEFGGKRIAMCHGHRYLSYDLILLNPGSISKPRQDNKIPTYTVMEIREDGKIDFRMCEMPY